MAVANLDDWDTSENGCVHSMYKHTPSCLPEKLAEALNNLEEAIDEGEPDKWVNTIAMEGSAITSKCAEHLWNQFERCRNGVVQDFIEDAEAACKKYKKRKTS